MPSLGGYLIVGAAAALITFVVTPLVGRLARRLGWIYQPNERTVHTAPVPDVGGIALFVGFIGAFGVARLMDGFDPLFARNSEPLGVVLAATVIFGVGLLDDVRDISAPAKVIGTVAAAMVLVWFGVTMYYFRLPFLEVTILSDDLIPLVTVLWLLGMSQAINLIDGLDGLAGGIVAIAEGTFFLYAYQLGGEGLLTAGNIGPLIAIVVLGACLGFLPHNIHPAKIFMGDGGALLLGLLMAASTMVVGGRTDRSFSGNSFFFFAPLLIPLVILGVPVIDTLFAIIRRARHRSGISTADKGHLHHRLMDLGHGHRRSVFILWTWTALLSGFVLWPIYSRSGDGLVPFGIAAILLSLRELADD